MKNQFEKATDQELKIYYEWCNTGIIPDNELGKMRDYYFEHLGVGFHTVMMKFLLELTFSPQLK